MRKKNFCSAVSLFLTVVFLIAVFSIVLYPRNNRASEATDAISGNKLLGEMPGTIDVLFVGDSQAYASVSPMELWESEGISAFVSGNGGQPICEMPNLVKEGFKEQQIKVVVFEADAVFVENSLSKYLYTKLKNVIPLLQYHDRWKTIGTDQFTIRKDFSAVDDLKGYRFSPQIEPYFEAHPDYMGAEESYEAVGLAAKLSVADIKKICDKNGAQLVILSVPNLSWNWGRHNSIRQLADETGAEFLDLNLPTEMEEIDWSNEAKDYGVHMNHSGAVKTTAFLGKYLKEQYRLEDHRGETGYESWDVSYRKYENMIKESIWEEQMLQ